MLHIPKKPLIVPGKWVETGSHVNAWQQRAITGLVAVVTQPTIDALNPIPDKETKKYTILKTFVKAVVGMSVGVCVRMGTQKLAKSLVKNNILQPIANIERPVNKPQFIDNLAMLFGVMACVVTNFMFDMPLTKKGMNWLANKLHLENGGNNKK